MSWKLLLAGILLLFVQTTPNQSASAAATAGIVVEIGYFPAKGAWFQDSTFHGHDDQVKLLPTYHPDGSIELTIGNAGRTGTDLSFLFSHDGTNQTHVQATALVRSDTSAGGSQRTWHLSELEGHVLVPRNDWGPGRPLDALFTIRGLSGKTPELLMGSFSIRPPK